MSVGFEHGVEDHQKLPHAGGDDNFRFFTLGSKSLGERMNDRIPTSCRKGGHVEHVADRRTTTSDSANAPMAAAVIIEGSDANERRNRLAVKPAEFGDFGDKRRAGHFGNARNARENVDLGAPVIVEARRRAISASS